MISPIKLFGKWYLCKDTTKPIDYPPLVREILVEGRLEIVELSRMIPLEEKERLIEQLKKRI